MSRRSNKRPAEKLELTYDSMAPSEDLREVYAAMFAPQPIEAPTEDITTPVGMTPVIPTPVGPTSDKTTPGKTTPVVVTPVRPDCLGIARAAQVLENFPALATIRTAAEPAAPAIPTRVALPPVSSTPPTLTPVAITGVGLLPVLTMPVEQEAPPPVITAPVITAPDPFGPARPYNVHRAVLVQDGHSNSEQFLYDILWRSGRPAENADAYRLVQIPQSELAAAVRMTTKNLRAALERLVEKLSIEQDQSFDRGTRLTRVWRVYSYKAILERRRGQGLEWVVRDRGVRFVDPKTIPVKPPRLVMPEQDETTGVKTTESTPVRAPQTTPVITTPLTLLGSSVATKNPRQTSTAAPAVVVHAIAREFGFVDDDAIQILIRKCRETVPDATDEEIAELGSIQARRIARMRNVSNPVGLLISQTAKCFTGEPFDMYRQEKAERERRLKELYDQD